MSVKAYWSTWAVTALAALLIFFTGNMTMLMVVVFGFLAFGLTFTGMMNVLPIVVTQSHESKTLEPKPVALQPMNETPAKAFEILRSA